MNGDIARTDIDLAVGVKPGLEDAGDNNKQNGGNAAEQDALKQVLKVTGCSP